MNNIFLKNQIINGLFIAILLAGCLILLRLSVCNVKTPLQPVHPSLMKNIKKEQAHAAKQFQQQLKSLQQKNQVFETQLAVVKEALRTARQKNKQLLQQQVCSVNSYVTDSTNAAGKNIQLLTATENTKDSLCDEVIALQEQQVIHKDSIIAFTNGQYHVTARLLEQSLQAGRMAQQQLKKEKRKKLAWKIATVAAGTLWLLKR